MKTLKACIYFILAGVGLTACHTKTITNKKAFYALSDSSGVILLLNEGRYFFQPITGDGFSPPFTEAESLFILLTDREMARQGDDITFTAPEQALFRFHGDAKSGEIRVHNNWKRIEITIKGGQRGKVGNTYTNVKHLTFLSEKEIEFYNKIPSLASNEILKLIKSREIISALPQRDIVLSSLVHSGMISSQYCLDDIGVYYDEKNS
jgi:hypothetical protein